MSSASSQSALGAPHSAHGHEVHMGAVVSASPEQVSCDMDAEVVILSLESGEYFGLNPVASSIWRLIQQPMSVAEIRSAVLEEYAGITPDECATEVIALLREMMALKLIRVHQD